MPVRRRAPTQDFDDFDTPTSGDKFTRGGDLTFGNGLDRPDAFYDLPTQERQSIIDLQNNAIVGNQEVPREVFGTRGPRTDTPRATPPTPTPAPTPPPTPDIDSLISQLPQGVEAQEPSGGTGVGAGASVAPMQSAVPEARSVSMRALPPSAMPARQPFASPVSLFGSGGGSSGVVGRGEGLFGGGIGMPGGPGQPKATEQMLALLEELGL